MKYEVIWHSINDVHYLVEADSGEEAIQELNSWIADPPEDGELPEHIQELPE
jgi:hypothetical protein